MDREDLTRRIASVRFAMEYGGMSKTEGARLISGAKLYYKLEGRRRRQARHAVERAVDAGRLKRPDVCPTCSHVSRKPLEAHHHRGYEPEHWLHVQWACSSACHPRLDQKGILI